MRRTPSVDSLIPALYLKGISTSDFSEAVAEIVVTYDMRTNELANLGELIGLNECTTPVYAPDGRRIALLSDGKAYIIVREVTK